MTLRDMQLSQPWNVPYSKGFDLASTGRMLPHLHATHAVLHASKSIGKLAAVFEALDHRDFTMRTEEEAQTIQNMAADLVTVALRLANLYNFDIETVLCERVKEKNGIGFSADDGSTGG